MCCHCKDQFIGIDLGGTVVPVDCVIKVLKEKFTALYTA